MSTVCFIIYYFHWIWRKLSFSVFTHCPSATATNVKINKNKNVCSQWTKAKAPKTFRRIQWMWICVFAMGSGPWHKVEVPLLAFYTVGVICIMKCLYCTHYNPTSEHTSESKREKHSSNKTPLIVMFDVHCAHAICPAQHDWAPTEAYVLKKRYSRTQNGKISKRCARIWIYSRIFTIFNFHFIARQWWWCYSMCSSRCVT